MHLYRGDPICREWFPLFDKFTAAGDTDFIGYVTVICDSAHAGAAQDVAVVFLATLVPRVIVFRFCGDVRKPNGIERHEK